MIKKIFKDLKEKTLFHIKLFSKLQKDKKSIVQFYEMSMNGEIPKAVSFKSQPEAMSYQLRLK